ncbi:hypothetical protein ACFFX0_26570 [Citricoccus parietis]|uniref:Uncharacterized protein n=1 Tax=Citricoccus parietis TaxID=592307 RepID=A0ABV5G6I0_9MICC
MPSDVAAPGLADDQHRAQAQGQQATTEQPDQSARDTGAGQCGLSAVRGAGTAPVVGSAGVHLVDDAGLAIAAVTIVAAGVLTGFAAGCDVPASGALVAGARGRFRIAAGTPVLITGVLAPVARDLGARVLTLG